MRVGLRLDDSVGLVCLLQLTSAQREGRVIDPFIGISTVLFTAL